MRLAALFALAACSLAAQDIYQRGAEVFKKSCAQGYCHGTAGAQGRAPKLTGRNFDQPAVAKIIYDGVPNTGMPGFKNQLAPEPLEAVIAYVVKISGGNYVPGASSASFTAKPRHGERARQRHCRCHSEGTGCGYPAGYGGRRGAISGARDGADSRQLPVIRPQRHSARASHHSERRSYVVRRGSLVA
jgi:hypothetical protein